MRVTNKRSVVADNVVISRSIFSQARGLILRKKTNLLFVFPTSRRVHLHMIGVLYPIDVVLLNREKRIVELQRIYPFQFYSSTGDALYVLEIAQGSVRGLVIGTQLTFSTQP